MAWWRMMGLEISARNTATHIETLLGAARAWQIRHTDAGANGLHRPGGATSCRSIRAFRVTCSLVKRVQRDDAFIADMDAEISAFSAKSTRSWTRFAPGLE